MIEKNTKEEIALLPLGHFTGKTEIITTKEQAVRACKKLSTEKILGFDTETRPSFKKGEHYNVAMIQLSTNEEAYLFRTNIMGVSEDLIEILKSENIIKAGVAIRDDIKAIQKLRDFNPGNFIEIQALAKEIGTQNMGLRALAAIFVKIRISKGAKLTNWELDKLPSSAIKYAATDAWISREIFLAMREFQKTQANQ